MTVWLSSSPEGWRCVSTRLSRKPPKRSPPASLNRARSDMVLLQSAGGVRGSSPRLLDATKASLSRYRFGRKAAIRVWKAAVSHSSRDTAWAMSEENVEALRPVYEEWGRGNFSPRFEVYAPDMEWGWSAEFPDQAGVVRDPELRSERLRRWLDSWEG